MYRLYTMRNGRKCLDDCGRLIAKKVDATRRKNFLNSLGHGYFFIEKV